ncbi:DUF805 domain-containing protein [Labrys neptuniae]
MTETTLVEKLFSFQGRLRRSAYWTYHVLQWIALCVIIGIFYGVALAVTPQSPLIYGLAVIAIALYVGFVWSGLSIGVRRCHDRNRSGWFLLASLIPLVGAIWVLIELGFLDGTQGPNQYGPSPKGIGGSEVAGVFS